MPLLNPAVASSQGTVQGAPLAARGFAARDRLFSLRWSDVGAFLSRQPLSFKLLLVYVFFEYIRPQAVYPVLAVLPWVSMCLLFAWISLVSERGKLYFGPKPVVIGLTVFTGVLILSGVFAVDPADSWATKDLYLEWLPIFALIVSLVNSERRLLVFMAGWLLWNYKMSLGGTVNWARCGFCYRTWGVLGTPGWFGNSGELAIEMCILLAISWHFYLGVKPSLSPPKRLLFASIPVTAVASTVGSTSRGGLLGIAAVVLWILAKSRYKVRGLLAVGVLAPLIWLTVPQESKARFDTAGTDKTSIRRQQYRERGWKIALEHPVLGIGYGNWIHVQNSIYHDNSELPHNIYIQAVAELGFAGLFAFVFLIFTSFAVTWQVRRMLRATSPPNEFLIQLSHGLDAALFSYLFTGYLVSVLYYPFFWINLALVSALYGTALAEVRRGQIASHGPGVPLAPAAPAAGWRSARRRAR